jgi:phenylacetate-CoA ligase
VLTRPGRLDELTVLVEARHALGEAERAALAHDLAGHIKSRIGVSAAVDVRPPDTVERSTGKMRRVVDQRAGDAGS